ncbi:small acid-soluble spore protein F (minor alpha/beta-type SASP) [Paenibacillus taihuensis]|uniref:Small acid-soluble spore protein F (Minor alpha/beta-type SASP) n=1 Tax=Paenibacillus taihuensis TaxID=1156355 RepID=A0A3D9QTI0_9BACL|nr:small acid-soluble spore protein F (minor alpha/beta-type SASP) [Paenibacillus taihuensis]
MSRRNRMMSEEMKKELAKELGFYDTVQKEGWGAIKAKDAGNMVKRAIQLAEQAVAKQYQAQQQGQQSAAYTAAYQPQNQQTGRTTYMPQQQSYAANSRTESPASRVTVPAYMHQAAQPAQQQPNHYPH